MSGRQVIYEDEHLLAVNKPAGIISAPKHRFMVSHIAAPSLTGVNATLGTAAVSYEDRWHLSHSRAYHASHAAYLIAMFKFATDMTSQFRLFSLDSSKTRPAGPVLAFAAAYDSNSDQVLRFCFDSAL